MNSNRNPSTLLNCRELYYLEEPMDQTCTNQLQQWLEEKNGAQQPYDKGTEPEALHQWGKT